MKLYQGARRRISEATAGGEDVLKVTCYVVDLYVNAPTDSRRPVPRVECRVHVMVVAA